MQLELKVFHIRAVQFGPQTAVADGVLSVNREQLRRLLLEDRRLRQIDIEVANPGERCRIARVADVIEPRAKVDGQDFPGALGPHHGVGSGSTVVLRGAAVAVSEYWASPGNRDPVGEFIDTWGPGGAAGPYGQLSNLALLPYPTENTTPPEYRIALKIAGLKTAAYLAGAGKSRQPDAVELYELPYGTGIAGLPRVAYIFQVLTNQFEPLQGDPVLYGDNIERIVPTIIHPNEILDGALVAPSDSRFMETYTIQNQPMIMELYRHHLKTLNFAGVIITNAPNNVAEYERAATVAANLAKWTLGADAAVLTKTGGGAPELTMARTAQRCEELGVKTVLAFLHMGIDTTDTSPKPATIFNAPEIDAMITMGAPVGSINVPAPDRVAGVPGGLTIDGTSVKQLRQVKGAMSQIGNSRLMAVRY
jgi:sarcosine reductase